ncbi:bifunctional diaminohydroxyphosphoribosylaminopyrimidine deaminase/5-amino-6-(5-phosphoribosylamino)uracil reductase RibD [Companilactobacillus mishanensis]|uniref:Riboflavin biosynthesis protein RibD n=1 Tax=Companilactobacillus mishanensis TaxID=2486008 RepID=A0ABW9P9Z9_9LACO|nr:bifunctional diaminohydroxyphosphoribosylaminopyrimidine deaminase/5-amino-6-(5-phosphoribosylamino)uracil reductase RibD [Companilactobacillus mishanensis]MQS45872.1 bifunctional diaminohydroxyphosphoribosylaminopyrimidine deaminase/5-amino-6-(5-phosphoribosylamino)uracil reductase RibD [Companilactobacillus mishanensis]
MINQSFMDLAFEEAKQGESTWTNPQVGAIIVKNNQVLAKGHHEKFGGPHAEVNTLNHLENIKDAEDSTMYVTLEPCSHFGKTPPCVQKVVEVGIKHVVIGMQDPNPIVSGNGIKYLQDHNVEVDVLNQTGGINEAYIFYYQNKRPLVTVKYAISLDGKINQSNHERTILTGKAAYLDSQNVRAANQAIMIGQHTLEIDDPYLTVRNQDLDFPPIRVVAVYDVNKLSQDLNIFKPSGAKLWILSRTESNRKLPDNIEVFVSDTWTPDKVVKLLAKNNIESLLVEGGSRIHADFVKEKLVDKIIIYQAPIILGGHGLPAVYADYPSSEIKFDKVQITQLGDDFKIESRRSE